MYGTRKGLYELILVVLLLQCLMDTIRLGYMLENQASRKPIYLLACAFFISLHLVFIFIVFRSVVQSDDEVVKVKRKQIAAEGNATLLLSIEYRRPLLQS